MTNNPFGQPLTNRISEELLRPFLNRIIEELIADGWLVEYSEGTSGHLLIFGRSGQSKYTASSETLEDLLAELTRNLNQSGAFPPELREHLVGVEQIHKLGREALDNQLSDLIEDDFQI